MQLKLTSSFGNGQSVTLEVPVGTTVEQILSNNGIDPQRALVRLIAPNGEAKTLGAADLGTPVPEASHVTATPTGVAGA